MKYHVTAKNRLTGRREAISKPTTWERCHTLKQHYTLAKIRGTPYNRLKVEPAAWQLVLNFNE